ncbi:hypothetical protein BSKO_00721 [Bryopsis sp. KO-2023]|nr:hypothetical protein BSKO_00721 [Bryopsis sp. KO-2023]
MLFGEMMDFEGAYELLDLAFDSGINFFDTAEMYPVPQRSETQGKSEEFLGKWMATKKRDEVVVSTKVCGPSGQMSWIRGGPHSLDRKNIKEAVEGSLRRLGTDHIDILHLHWPDRYVPMFGEVEYDPSRAYQSIPIREQLDALGECVNEGKVRHAGLSNETAWGLMNLLDRVLDMSLAECCHLEGIGVLAYSPLAMGLLTGKYLREDGGPPEARLNKYKNRYAEAESRYGPKPNVTEAIKAYSDLASHWEMSLLELATRFVSNRSLISSIIFGASNSGQLREILAAASKPPLPQELAHEIDTIHQKYPNPTP